MLSVPRWRMVSSTEAESPFSCACAAVVEPIAGNTARVKAPARSPRLSVWIEFVISFLPFACVDIPEESSFHLCPGTVGKTLRRGGQGHDDRNVDSGHES